MDTELKHRLTGAVILVALVVLLVPEMLSGPSPSARAPDADALRLPALGAAPSAPVRSIDIDLGESARAVPAAPPAAAPAVAAPAAAANGSAPPSPSSPAAPSTPAVPAAPIERAAAPMGANAADARASAPAAASPRLPLTGRFSVQAGSFAARDSAESLAARLRSKGFEVQVSAVQAEGRTLHRVRVGTAGDRVAAEALLMRLRAAGHNGSVVAAD